MTRYFNRYEAGKILAELLKQYANRPIVIVLALPRGGVPVAYEIATALSVPLDVFIVRKLGVPTHEELAMGAIASGGTIIYNKEIISELHITQLQIDQVIASEQQELERRNKKYRGDKLFPELKNKIIILVDDGIATGATMRAAVAALKKLNPKKIVMAVPVAALDTIQLMTSLVDEIVCPLQPAVFNAVGLWYEHFDQTDDAEVYELLSKLNNKL
jgi:putative phosphoribosyl transferase